MSSIPYNYGSYIDAKVSMTDTGHVSAGKQIQSPASAGSRGLAKTTQFTNDRTQMQMGNSPIAESMIEIRNIMNRIDGINVPTNEMNELADDEKMEFTKILLDISAIKDRIERLSMDDDAKKSAIQSLTNAEEALVALDETAVQEAESDYLYHNGKEINQGSIVYDMQDYSDGIFELQSAKYADGTELDEKELEELESTQELIDWVMIDFVSESAVQEDAGEGHMSKSQLYQTAKMAIELLDMINKGDDLEGWVQTKLNLAADYLQAVYHYEDYQKLNPYREELDSSLMQRHAGIIQKHLDEILERKCRAEDVDTKPGMMRILKKRVNEVEKEIAKKGREHTNESVITEDPRAVGRALANLKYAKT